MPPLFGDGGELVSSRISKADLLSDHFAACRESADQPLTGHPSCRLTTFAFIASEVRRLLLDVDPYRGTDSLGMFPLFLQ